MLPSHTALEMQKGKEKTIFPGGKGSKEVKMGANKSSVFSHNNKYQVAGVKDLSSEFECYREIKEVK